jgi:hypothetical protein
MQKQQRRLALLPPTWVKKRTDFKVTPGSLPDSFRNWLDSVISPASTTVVALATPITRLPRLTALDITRVNHATIREGESHCVWPPSIIRRFHTAAVITEKKVPHYQLRDVNLTKVK